MNLKSKIGSFKGAFKEFLKTTDNKQLTLIVGLLLFFIILSVSSFVYYRNTEVGPAEGGTYTEGLLGAPRFLNPVYSQKSEADKDLTEIIYAGLMRYDEENKPTPYLADSIETEDNREFNIILREDIYWSDGEKITADDVIFTIEKIQNRNIQSPLRISWEGVRTERVSEKELNLFLENSSPLFIEKLTLKPIPEHLWSEVDSDDFQFSEYNLDPVSSGAYKVDQIIQEENKKEVKLVRNPHYFEKEAYIENLNFKFFDSERELLESRDELDGFALPSIKNEVNSSFSSYKYRLPRYFALFFNLERFNEETRKALRMATDKESILDSIDNVNRVNSPIIPDFYGLPEPEVDYELDREEALSLFKEEGYELSDEGKLEIVTREETSFEFTERISQDDQGEEVRQLQRCLIDLTEEHDFLFPEGEVTGYFDQDTEDAVNRFQDFFREDILDPHGFENPTGIVAGSTQSKLNELCGGPIPEEREQLTVRITTINHPLLAKVVEELEDQWNDLGIAVVAEKVDHQSIQAQVIEEKDYDSFLFGISMESMPDPFRWWHSSQTESPGLNFTNYKNSEVDQMLTDAITLSEEDERNEALDKFQNKLLEDKPAIFLYSPHYIHMVSDDVQGIKGGRIVNSSQRFKNINNWYINTTRIWKNN